MSRNQINFFATRKDLEAVFGEVESLRQLQLVLAGLFDSPDIVSYECLIDLPCLNTVLDGFPLLEHNFLIADNLSIINVREVPQRKGGIKYAIDQLLNPHTVTLRTGGIHASNFVSPGMVGTISRESTSLQIFKLLKKEILRQFVRIHSYYVGPEAEALLDAGWRLTRSLKTPTDYDLRRDESF